MNMQYLDFLSQEIMHGCWIFVLLKIVANMVKLLFAQCERKLKIELNRERKMNYCGLIVNFFNRILPVLCAKLFI